jgi:protein phosphatase methylesterase 1
LSVIDVVEGTAMDALQYMDAIIQAKPKGFASIEDAIKWT